MNNTPLQNLTEIAHQLVNTCADLHRETQRDIMKTLPSGWVPLNLTWDGDEEYPEVVAYGPKPMMDRLGKRLEKYYTRLIAERAAEGTARRMRDLAAGVITGEIKQFEYSLAADRIQELEGIVEKLEHAQVARMSTPGAPVTAEPVLGAFLNKQGGITLCQNGAESTFSSFKSYIYPAPADRDAIRDQALVDARAAVRELQDNLEAFGPYGQESARVALDGALDAIDELKGRAADAAETRDAKGGDDAQ